MKEKIFNRKIPTILGIILVLLGIPLTTFIIKNQTIFNSMASDSQSPKNIKVTNVSEKSFTITYQTDMSITGSISYGSNNKLGESGLEDADKKTGSFTPRMVHSISIDKLTPDTKYYLAIVSGSNTFLNKNSPFEILTGPDISSPSANQDLIKGKIILPDGNAPSEALIFLSAENSQVLSSTITKDGKFSFSLKDLRTNDLSSYFNVSENTVFNIIATNGPLTSNALVSLNQTGTIPTITLSNNYDFAQESLSTASESAQLLGFPSVSALKINLKPAIIAPTENQSLTDQIPQFRGTSLPNENVEIIIHSDEQITAQVTADSNGNWTYKPPNNLSPGAHTITIKTRDSTGILTTVMQSFTVFAAGEPIPTLATPSATPIQNLIVTSTPIPVVSLIPLPISTPNQPQVLIPPESKGGLPPTGSPPTLLIAGSIITIVFGLILFLITHVPI